MKTETKIVLFLLLIPPIMGEFVTGNKINSILNPLAFIMFFTMFILLYGCGTLIIRELRTRWDLQWSVAFLLIAYGIFEEGFMTKAFFNPDWTGLGTFSGYGMYLGVQWPWAIGVTFAHATISTLFAIVISDYAWPEYRNKPLLGKKGWLLALTGFIGMGIFGHLMIGNNEGGDEPFFPETGLTIATLIVIAGLVLLVFSLKLSKLKSNAKLRSPFYFGTTGFVLPGFFLFSSMLVSSIEAPAMLMLYAIVLALAFFFMKRQIYNVEVTTRHITALVFGTLLFWVAILPLHIAWGKIGMVVLLPVVLILTWRWRREVLKKENSKTLNLEVLARAGAGIP